MRKLCVVIAISALVLGGALGCASKSMVRRSTGEINSKIDALGESLEETQERTRQNERRIGQVDQKVDSASQTAQAANRSATNAASAARAAGTRIEAIDKASRRLVYDLAVSADEGNFEFGKANLPAETRQKIDELILKLTQDPQNVFIEIEGHTDDVGSPAANARLGLARAEAVQRYLYEQYQIPLHKMNVISFGEERPIAPNSTEEGRAQNRRVVIRVRM